MADILFCHDNEDFATTREQYWRMLGLSVEVCTTVAQARRRIQTGGTDFQTIVIHKDFGQYSGEDSGATAVLELLDGQKFIRRGVVSGEYPHGKRTVLNEFAADFYFPTVMAGDDPWLVTQLKKGYANPVEILLRGKTVSTP